MDVILPTTGCNVLVDDSHIINYDSNSQTIKKYSIYEGVIHQYSEESTVEQNIYTGNCLSTGDLVYSPSDTVWYGLSSALIFCCIVYFLYKITIGRFIK